MREGTGSEADWDGKGKGPGEEDWAGKKLASVTAARRRRRLER